LVIPAWRSDESAEISLGSVFHPTDPAWFTSGNQLDQPSNPRISVLIPGFEPDRVYILWFAISIIMIPLIVLALA
jgi:hypothetical protein